MSSVEKKLPPVKAATKRKQTEPNISQTKRIDQNSFHLQQSFKGNQLSQSQISSNSQRILQQFYQETDPFYMGATRHDKNRYQGSPDSKANDKLYKYYTIARANRVVKTQELGQSFQVKGHHQGVQNIYKNNKIVQDILRESNVIGKNSQLMETIYKLKEMKLLDNEYQIKTNQLSKNVKVEYVYNDYHTRATNPGYARNALGTFYTK